MTSLNQFSDDLAAEKALLRGEAARRRDHLHQTIDDAGSQVAWNFHENWSPPSGTVVSAFWPFRSELDLRLLLHRLHEAGQVIALPVVVAKRAPLLFRLWTPDTSLEVGGFGVATPPESAPLVEPDWLLVPLLAFDDKGYRLGYGGGFYDRTLAALRARKSIFAIGVGYDGQQVNQIPHGTDDGRLDAIVTERRALILEH
jgi:5-formyltetrahydrofolate cyclo-ligase